MSFLHILGYFACLIILAIISLKILIKETKISKYEYLDYLSITEWRVGRDICKAMQHDRGGWMNYGTFYTTMTQLETEGLVESKDHTDEDGRCREFRKTGSGPRKKQGGKFSPLLLPQPT